MVAITGFTKLESESLDGIKRINITSNVDLEIKSVRGIKQVQAILQGNASAEQSSIIIERVEEDLDIKTDLKMSPIYFSENENQYQIPPTTVGIKLEIQLPEDDEVLRDIIINSINGNIYIARGINCKCLHINNAGTSNVGMYGSVSDFSLQGNTVTLVGDIIAISDIKLNIVVYTGCIKLTIDDIVSSNVVASTLFGFVDGAIKGDPSGRFNASGQIQLCTGSMILR